MAALHVAIHEKWHWWGWPVPVLEHWHRTRRFWHYHLKSFDNDDFQHFWLGIFQDIPILELAMAWRASPEAKAAAQKLINWSTEMFSGSGSLEMDDAVDCSLGPSIEICCSSGQIAFSPE